MSDVAQNFFQLAIQGNGMSEKIDQFTESLRVNLTNIERQLHGLKDDLSAERHKDVASIEAKLDTARKSLDAAKAGVKGAESKAQTWIKAKQEAGAAVIQGWKDKFDRSQMDRYADRAEDNAAAANSMAEAAVAEAAVATYEAIGARNAAREMARS